MSIIKQLAAKQAKSMKTGDTQEKPKSAAPTRSSGSPSKPNKVRSQN